LEGNIGIAQDNSNNIQLSREKSVNLSYPIPLKVAKALLDSGFERLNKIDLVMDTTTDVDDVFNVMFQFFESSLGFHVSSNYHFNETTQIEDLMTVLEISTILGFEEIVDNMISHSVEARVKETN